MTTITLTPGSAALRVAAALALGLAPAVAAAQDMDHSAHTPPLQSTEDAHAEHVQPQPQRESDHDHAIQSGAKTPVAAPTDEGVDHAAMGHEVPPPDEQPEVDHAAVGRTSGQEADTTNAFHTAMGHSPAIPKDETGPEHAGMEHGESADTHQGMDHSKMGNTTPPPRASEVDHAAMGHGTPPVEQDSGVDHAAMGHGPAGMAGTDLPPTAAPLEPIPHVTDADRAAAFPDVAGHAVHDTAVHWFALVDRLETWHGDDGTPLAWEGTGWIGTDLDRAWIRSEGEAEGGSVESANVELFYGRAIARWWDAVVGVRHDFGDDPSQTFFAVGVMGLAPYMFEVEATAYAGESGQTGLGVEAEYETLFTNRLILQSVIEAEAWGKDDPARGIGSGLGKVEAGFRLRYEFTRKFAPYIGVVRERVFGETADLRNALGGEVDDTRFVIGLRTWF